MQASVDMLLSFLRFKLSSPLTFSSSICLVLGAASSVEAVLSKAQMRLVFEMTSDQITELLPRGMDGIDSGAPS